MAEDIAGRPAWGAGGAKSKDAASVLYDNPTSQKIRREHAIVLFVSLSC
jgi:hypothetical protein